MELRLYSFTNFYLSGIQKGIQTAHAIADMEIEYRGDFLNEAEQNMAAGLLEDDDPEFTFSEFQYMGLYSNWAENHKTIIVLNGGNSKTLTDIFEEFLAFKDNKEEIFDYPFTIFEEDEQSLNGAVTCVAIIVTENIFGVTSLYRKDPEAFKMQAKEGIAIEFVDGASGVFTYTDAEIRLIEILATSSLATN